MTILVGMMVRNLVFDDGTASSFVIVATLFVMTGMHVIKAGGAGAFFRFTPDQSNMVFAQLGLDASQSRVTVSSARRRNNRRIIWTKGKIVPNFRKIVHGRR